VGEENPVTQLEKKRQKTNKTKASQVRRRQKTSQKRKQRDPLVQTPVEGEHRPPTQCGHELEQSEKRSMSIIKEKG
jgi:hypothetical protein